MDYENTFELVNLPLTQGEASLPPPPATKKVRRPNPEDDDVYLIPIPPWTAKEICIACIATVTVFGSIVTLLISINPFATAMGILGILIPPYSALQEQKITDCKGMSLILFLLENYNPLL